VQALRSPSKVHVLKKKSKKNQRSPSSVPSRKFQGGPSSVPKQRQYVGKSNSARPPNPGRAQNDFLYMKKKKLLKILEPYRN
jgi:hypothetical protein